jgi:SAM-dependent methyltransferase
MLDHRAAHNKPKLSQLLDRGMDIRSEPQCDLENLLDPHKNLFEGKNVLDLGCHTGVSTHFVKDSGASVVIGVDFNKNAIDLAKEHFSRSGVIFSCQDLEQTELLAPLVDLADVVITLGSFYHFHNQHNFLKTIAKSHIEYILIDSLYGPETTNPDIYVRFEKRAAMDQGLIPKYAPNLSWFQTQLNILGFGLDRVEKYYTTLDFSKVTDYNANMRMCMRFFNKTKFPGKLDFDINEIWEWSDQTLIQEKK